MKRRWVMAFVLCLLMAGCTNVPVSQSVDTRVIATAPVTDETAATEPDDGKVDIQITPLTFEGQGNTFLEAIADVIREAGEPADHRYVAFGDGENGDVADGPWQGEALIYADRVIILLQQMQTGSDSALRLDAPNMPDPMTALDAILTPTEPTTSLPDAVITFVRARLNDNNTWSFDVSLDHPDTGWEDYADGWHVETPDGRILATRILLHPHVAERPFTRGQGGVIVPDDVTEVYIRSHELISGYGRQPVIIPLTEAVQEEKYQVLR